MSVVRNTMEMVKVIFVSIWIGLISMITGPVIPYIVKLPLREYWNEPIMLIAEYIVYTLFAYGAMLMYKERFHASFDIALYRPKVNINRVYNEFYRKYNTEIEKGVFEETFTENEVKKEINKWMLIKLVCVAVMFGIITIAWSLTCINETLRIVGEKAFYGAVVVMLFVKLKKGYEIKITENSSMYEKMSIALMNLMYARHVWQIGGCYKEYHPENNYNITRNTHKNKVYIESKKPLYIKSNLSIMSIKFKQERWIFAPAGIIVVKKFKVKKYDYSQLMIRGGERDCVDGYRLPRDVKPLQVLYQNINKNDSRDKRFRHEENNSRWLYRAGVIEMKLGDDRQVELQVSNVHSSNNFLETVEDYEYIEFNKSERDCGIVKAFPPAIISNVLGV